MNVSLKRVRAIFVKDYKEFSRNYAISIMLICPIVLALLIRGIDSSLPLASVAATFANVLNISFLLMTCFAQACLIAEEKERNTLRSLRMTPATTLDILIGKSALVFVMSAIVLAAAALIFGYKPGNIAVFVIVIILSLILYIALGTICGLFSKTLLEASLSILPVCLLFTAAPWGALLEDEYPVFRVLDYMPSSQLVHALRLDDTGFTMGDVWKPLLLIFIWTVGLTAAAVMGYQRQLKNE
ncbi:ABC transporter permease [Saccharibacillus kuerlensis]|uniref:ABC transporter permease n=1 Tax=Saccharibacillus kuerlensis TaxID=459527 RepID=UPI000594A323|nr:ABC transporter permease [Saccharibacillus kuerlensis]